MLTMSPALILLIWYRATRCFVIPLPGWVVIKIFYKCVTSVNISGAFISLLNVINRTPSLWSLLQRQGPSYNVHCVHVFEINTSRQRAVRFGLFFSLFTTKGSQDLATCGFSLNSRWQVFKSHSISISGSVCRPRSAIITLAFRSEITT